MAGQLRVGGITNATLHFLVSECSHRKLRFATSRGRSHTGAALLSNVFSMLNCGENAILLYVQSSAPSIMSADTSAARFQRLGRTLAVRNVSR